MKATKKNLMRVVSLVVCLAMLASFGVVRFAFSADAASQVRVVNGKAVATSSGAFLQAYIFTFLAALFIGMAQHQH